METKIDFSAQMGGGDADDAILPHFNILKSVAEKHSLGSAHLPVQKLVFILRVDGNISTYGPSGPEHIDVTLPKYISVDINIRVADWIEGPAMTITSAIQSSADQLERLTIDSLANVDYVSLRRGLNQLCMEYEAAQQTLDSHVDVTSNPLEPFEIHYHSYSANEGTKSSSRVKIRGRESVVLLAERVVRKPGDFFGITDGDMLQMMVTDDGELLVEIPRTKEKGSYQKVVSITQLRPILESLALPISPEQLRDTKFILWS